MWTIRFYKTPSGRSPVKEFIRGLSPEKQAAIIEEIDLLEEYGIYLEMPHARHIGDRLWELRARAEDGLVRVLYFSTSKENKTFVLLHGIEKDQRKIKPNDRKTAIRRMREYERREKNE